MYTQFKQNTPTNSLTQILRIVWFSDTILTFMLLILFFPKLTYPGQEKSDLCNINISIHSLMWIMSFLPNSHNLQMLHLPYLVFYCIVWYKKQRAYHFLMTFIGSRHYILNWLKASCLWFFPSKYQLSSFNRLEIAAIWSQNMPIPYWGWTVIFKIWLSTKTETVWATRLRLSSFLLSL